jgi:hypothetical protein
MSVRSSARGEGTTCPMAECRITTIYKQDKDLRRHMVRKHKKTFYGRDANGCIQVEDASSEQIKACDASYGTKSVIADDDAVSVSSQQSVRKRGLTKSGSPPAVPSSRCKSVSSVRASPRQDPGMVSASQVVDSTVLASLKSPSPTGVAPPRHVSSWVSQLPIPAKRKSILLPYPPGTKLPSIFGSPSSHTPGPGLALAGGGGRFAL